MLLVQFLPSFTLTGLNIVVPVFFQKVVTLEDYWPDFEIKVTIFRTVFLRLASVMVLVVSLRTQIVACAEEFDQCGSCVNTVGRCWETFVGQQIYRLVILDFIVVTVVTLAVECPRKIVVKKFSSFRLVSFIGYQEFDIPKNVLDLVYAQTLCWLGAFFSPLIPAITVMKMLIYFYLKKLTVLKNCLPPNRPYRASRSSAFFMTILMFSFVLCVIPVVYSIGRISPSQGCGAFRVYSKEDFTMFTIVKDGIEYWPTVPHDIMEFLGSWTFYVPMTVLLCLLIYYYVAVISGHKRMVELLKEQLALDGKDKQYLLSQVRIALMRGDFKKK